LYSVFEASRYLQIPENTLRSWVSGRSYPLRSGSSRRSEPVIELADPTGSRLSFNNLTEAHVLDALRRQYQVELPQIRRAVSYLREHFRNPHPLVHHEMLTDGKHLFVEAAGLRDVINASRHGQLAMRDLIGLHLQRVEWDKEGFVARLYPFTRSRRSPAEESSQPRVVTMDPRVEFGRPVLKVSAVPTAVIADRYKAGESIADLADDYGENPLNIEEAVRCELQPAKPDRDDHFELRLAPFTRGRSLFSNDPGRPEQVGERHGRFHLQLWRTQKVTD
jgi:uncharacterized protein (DUF433 family)